MAKAKLELKNSELSNLKSVAEFCGVDLGDAKQIGDTTMTEISFKTGEQLFKMGRLMETVKNTPKTEGK